MAARSGNGWERIYHVYLFEGNFVKIIIFVRVVQHNRQNGGRGTTIFALWAAVSQSGKVF
jgi:hypothetical protein